MKSLHHFRHLTLMAVCIGASCALFAESARARGTAAAGQRQNAQATNPVVVLRGLDPVLLTRGKEVPGSQRISANRKGYRYLFANADNSARFQHDLNRYEIQLNGRCAMMPAVQGDPRLFAVYKERIYIFGSVMCRTAFVAGPEKYLKPRKNVAIFVNEGVELLDFAGPGEVFSTAGEGREFNVYTVAASPEPIVSQGFVTVTPEYTFANSPRPDILIVPGGAVSGPLRNRQVLVWIRNASRHAEITLSVCTGAFLLARAGLLDGKEATTHWRAIDTLKQEAPRTRVLTGRRYVDNGKIVTSAGVSAGTDAALHIVRRLLGEQVAQETARYMEYDREPARSQAR